MIFQENLNIKCDFIGSPGLPLANSQHHMTGQCQLIWIFMFSGTHAVFPEQMFESQLWQSVLWSHLVWHNSLAIYFQLKCQNVELKPRHRDRWPFVKYFLPNYLKPCVLQILDWNTKSETGLFLFHLSKSKKIIMPHWAHTQDDRYYLCLECGKKSITFYAISI